MFGIPKWLCKNKCRQEGFYAQDKGKALIKWLWNPFLFLQGRVCLTVWSVQRTCSEVKMTELENLYINEAHHLNKAYPVYPVEVIGTNLQEQYVFF